MIPELRGAGVPDELDGSGGTVSLLGDDQLGEPRLVGIFLRPVLLALVVVLSY